MYFSRIFHEMRNHASFYLGPKIQLNKMRTILPTQEVCLIRQQGTLAYLLGTYRTVQFIDGGWRPTD